LAQPDGGDSMGDTPHTVLLTGASSGIGLALSRLLLPLARYRLILTARASSLPRFAAAGIHESDRGRLRPMDVTVDDHRVAVVEEALQDWDGVDVLVNNAGIAYRAVVEHVTDEERMEQMGINFRGAMALVRLVLPRMRAKGMGRIINVSSVGGMMTMPTMAIYSASKFALECATEALYYEVKTFGIHATLIEPGFIDSSSFQNTHYTSQAARSEADPLDPYHCHYRHMAPFIERTMRLSLATPEKVARRILRTINTTQTAPAGRRHARRCALRCAAACAPPSRLPRRALSQPPRHQDLGQGMIKRDDIAELAFRGLFCVIFLGLGRELLFSDELFRLLMPAWVPWPPAVSILVGLWLVVWGALILLGFRLRCAAIALGAFVVVVTAAVHGPAMFTYPTDLPVDSRWMWDILQRSNFVKNLYLLGVCFHLLHHRTGCFSLDAWLRGDFPWCRDRKNP
jgi:hypothetical protein